MGHSGSGPGSTLLILICDSLLARSGCQQHHKVDQFWEGRLHVEIYSLDWLTFFLLIPARFQAQNTKSVVLEALRAEMARSLEHFKKIRIHHISLAMK